MRRIILPAALVAALVLGWVARDIKIPLSLTISVGPVTITIGEPPQPTPTPTITPVPTPTPACGELKFEDDAHYQGFNAISIRQLVESMGLECVEITIRLAPKPWSYFDHEEEVGTAEAFEAGAYLVTIYVPTRSADLASEYYVDRCNSEISLVEYLGDMTLAHELRHVWQLVSRLKMTDAEAERDAERFECDFYRRDARTYITWRGEFLLPRPPTPVPSTAWLTRMNDLIGRFYSWQNGLRRYVGSDNFILPGYWDVFCGQMWMYEELHAIRRITPSNYISWIDAWLAVDRYHEYMCKGNFPTNQEESRQIWGEWNRLIDEANRLAP